MVWIDLAKEHYGIHGTDSPDRIGRAESNGCIRLTNWDAARLAQMVKPGIQAVFKADRRAAALAQPIGTAIVTAILVSAFWLFWFGITRQRPAGRGDDVGRQGRGRPQGRPPGRWRSPRRDGRSGRARHPGRRGQGRRELVDTFTQARAGGARVHDAIDIMAPTGTPVVSVAPGTVEKLFFSQGGGGITAYVRSEDGRWSYYYAHLNAYAPGLREGQKLQRGTPGRLRRLYRQRQSGRPAPPFRHQPHGAGREMVSGQRRSTPIRCLPESARGARARLVFDGLRAAGPSRFFPTFSI